VCYKSYLCENFQRKIVATSFLCLTVHRRIAGDVHIYLQFALKVTHALKSRGSNHITGTAEPKVVKFCTLVGYINSSNMMTCHQQKGRGYGHVTVLKFCRLSWCSASRGFVSDSWAKLDFIVVSCWNNLLSTVTGATSLKQFINALARVDLTNYLQHRF